MKLFHAPLLALLLAACTHAAPPIPVQLVVEVCSPHPAARGYPDLVGALFEGVDGADIWVAPVTGTAYTEAPIRVVLPAADPLGNPLVTATQQREARTRLAALVRRWQARCGGHRQGAEILAAVEAAAERLPPSGGALVVVTSGFEQSAPLNLYDTRVQDVSQWVRAARLAGWHPPRPGIEVCMTGLTNGDGLADSRLTARVADFWRRWVSAQGGALQAYGSAAQCRLGSGQYAEATGP